MLCNLGGIVIGTIELHNLSKAKFMMLDKVIRRLLGCTRKGFSVKS